MASASSIGLTNQSSVRDTVAQLLNFEHYSGSEFIIRVPSDKWRKASIKRLDELGALQTNWDGYGSGPVLFGCSHFALSMLDKICTPNTVAPDIIPGNNGDVQIEWHTNTVDIELHVRAPNDVHAWRRTNATGFDGEEFELTNDFTIVANWIKQFNSELVIEAATA